MSSTRRVWFLAMSFALLLHGALVGTAVWRLPVATAQAPATVPLQLVFDRFESQGQQEYVEQPEPETPEAADDARRLSNVDATAQDLAEGAGEPDPVQSGEAEFPSVAMEAGSREAQLEPQTSTLRSVADPLGELTRSAPQEPSRARSLVREASGDELFDQPEAQRLGSGVDLFGQVQLSTIAWEYAPWLQRFRAALIRNWQAPYAFYLGLIHGQQRIRVEVGRDGELRSLTLLDSEGHDSLRSASLAAFRAAAPYAPLPDPFPDDSLFMTWTLIYPERRR